MDVVYSDGLLTKISGDYHLQVSRVEMRPMLCMLAEICKKLTGCYAGPVL